MFHWASQGRVSLPWEAKALDGLELPAMVVRSYPQRKNSISLKFKFAGNKKMVRQKLVRCPECDQGGGIRRPNGRVIATKRAKKCDETGGFRCWLLGSEELRILDCDQVGICLGTLEMRPAARLVVFPICCSGILRNNKQFSGIDLTDHNWATDATKRAGGPAGLLTSA